jgi:hypothetical protein
LVVVLPWAGRLGYMARQGILDMRTIDAVAVSLAVIASLAIGQMSVQPSADELAAETWMLEQDVIGLLGAMSRPAQACYAMTLHEPKPGATLAALAQARAGVMLAAACDPSMLAQLA